MGLNLTGRDERSRFGRGDGVEEVAVAKTVGLFEEDVGS